MHTILLVEDDAAVRKVLRHMLAHFGHRVLEAGNAPEALQLAASYPGAIDVLVTDVVMPQTNCDRFVEQLRESRPALEVIFISGYSEEMLNWYGVGGARSNFIQKPFNAETLAEKVRELLAPSRTRTAGAGD
jgi:two-component system, cell cycle sensor histidine kinase and response regulator CckA